jgi:hypothetical protein
MSRDDLTQLQEKTATKTLRRFSLAVAAVNTVYFTVEDAGVHLVNGCCSHSSRSFVHSFHTIYNIIG